TEAALVSFSGALAAFERAGDRRSACNARMNLGYAYGQVGEYARAEEILRAALVGAERMGLSNVQAYTLHNLGKVVGHRGQYDEARDTEARAIANGERHGDAQLLGAARLYLAIIELL